VNEWGRILGGQREQWIISQWRIDGAMTGEQIALHISFLALLYIY
jgi:hypothetical protein